MLSIIKKIVAECGTKHRKAKALIARLDERLITVVFSV
jgi:hypothetical protein